MNIDTASDVHNKDRHIQYALKQMVNKENNIYDEYLRIQELRNDDSMPDSVKTEFDKLLDERALYLSYKLQTKEQQQTALYKILDYLNLLDNKYDKERSNDIENLMVKIEYLEDKIDKIKSFPNLEKRNKKKKQKKQN